MAGVKRSLSLDIRDIDSKSSLLDMQRIKTSGIYSSGELTALLMPLNEILT
jgi:hypothetical protein